MPELREKAQRAWVEFKESCEMVVEIEREGLKASQLEAERNYYLIMRRLRRRKD